MNVEELIEKLKAVNGKLTVVVESGGDPSDLDELSRVVVEECYYFPANSLGYGKELVVRLR